MAQLRHDISVFDQAQTAIVVIGPEKPDDFSSFWRDNDLPFIGLPDPAHAVLELLGQQVKLLKLGRMPAQILVDRNGVVRFAHYGHSMSDITGNEEILALLASPDGGYR